MNKNGSNTTYSFSETGAFYILYFAVIYETIELGPLERIWIFAKIKAKEVREKLRKLSGSI
jgi:hypothetical protein